MGTRSRWVGLDQR